MTILKKYSFHVRVDFVRPVEKKLTDQWIKKSMNVLPKTKWQHITFTMPDSLWPIFWFNRKLFGLIFAIAANIIKEFALKKNIVVGIFAALHTFGRDLKRNVHIHLSVTCGGLDTKGKWKKIFFPSEPIKKMWRYRIISLFRTLYLSNDLILPDKYKKPIDFNNWMKSLYEINWYVYLQKPSDDHSRNIEYLGRYIKRPPISEARIEEYSNKQVTFIFLDHYNNTVQKISMGIFNFIARLISHIPDKHFRMIRYYGFLSNRSRTKLLPMVYSAIEQIKPKLFRSITWRNMLWKTLGNDPLLCKSCNLHMVLSGISFGLPPP